jgi:nicotinamidase-related amidase
MKTKEICAKLKTDVSKFRNADIPVIWLYMDEGVFRPANPLKSYDGFYLAEPDYEKDTLIPKRGNSGFIADENRRSKFMYNLRGKHRVLKLEKHLQKENISTLLVAGVNLSACVKETARIAVLRGYNVVLLSDLVANDNENPANGIHMVRAVADSLKAPALKEEWGVAASMLPTALGQVHEMTAAEALQHISARNGLKSPRVF